MEGSRTEFLSSLFGDAISARSRLVVWSLPSKAAAFCDTLDKASAKIEADVALGSDVYYGVGLVRNGLNGGRGKASDVNAITSLWADIDIANGKHKRPDLPPNVDEAKRILAAIGVPASIIVHSGGGLHVYWKLKEPLTQEDGIGKIAKQWSDTVIARARGLGYACDAVGDLSRVLRVPGTFNHKTDPPAEVRIIHHMDYAYEWSDLEQVAVEPETPAPAPIGLGDVCLHPEAFPDARALDAALDNDKRFRQTWERNRQELPDQSTSGYHMALAHWGVMAELPDQEIVNLIIGWHSKHREPIEKVLRRDYIRRTIEAARGAKRRMITPLEAVREHVATEQVHEVNPDDPFADLRGTMGVDIVRVIKRGVRNARYSVVLEDSRELRIGKARDFLSQHEFRIALCDGANIVLRRLTTAVWNGLVQTMIKHAEKVELPEGDDEVSIWVQQYFSDRAPRTEEEWRQAARDYHPFLKDGKEWLHLPTFKEWLTRAMGERMDRQTLRSEMHSAGFRPSFLTIHFTGEKLGRWYWGR